MWEHYCLKSFTTEEILTSHYPIKDYLISRGFKRDNLKTILYTVILLFTIFTSGSVSSWLILNTLSNLLPRVFPGGERDGI